MVKRVLSLTFLLALLMGCQKSEKLAGLSKMGILNVPEKIVVQIDSYCPAASSTYKDLFVRNLTTEVFEGEIHIDRDNDGISDDIEISHNTALNIRYDLADGNGDLFSDLLIYLAGIIPAEQTKLRCQYASNIDTDGDGISYNGMFLGLNDCEESRLTLTDQARVDTDLDGIPDYLELRCGLNPKNPNDALLDPDSDGALNIDECKKNTPVDESNLSYGIAQVALNYDVQRDFDNPNCYQIQISNVPLLKGAGENLIAFYLLESTSQQVTTLRKDILVVRDNEGGKTFQVDQWTPSYPTATQWRIMP